MIGPRVFVPNPHTHERNLTMRVYILPHPETGDVIVIDRMTAQDARKRNEAFAAMRYPYRWEQVTTPPRP